MQLLLRLLWLVQGRIDRRSRLSRIGAHETLIKRRKILVQILLDQGQMRLAPDQGSLELQQFPLPFREPTTLGGNLLELGLVSRFHQAEARLPL